MVGARQTDLNTLVSTDIEMQLAKPLGEVAKKRHSCIAQKRVNVSMFQGYIDGDVGCLAAGGWSGMMDGGLLLICQANPIDHRYSSIIINPGNRKALKN